MIAIAALLFVSIPRFAGADIFTVLPNALAVDPAGHVYIAEANHDRVREIGPDGRMVLIAGSGPRGYSGDGGPAAAAELNEPEGITFDATGDLYIADTKNMRIRKVDRTGIITTIAGNGTAGFSGDGGPAVLAKLGGPIGLAFDTEGDLFECDAGNNRIRKIDASGVISTVAGSGKESGGDGGPALQAGFAGPWGLAIDRQGDLFVSEASVFVGSRIRRISTDGVVTTIAGTGQPGYSGDGGPAASAQISASTGVAVDDNGNVFFADGGNQRVRKIDEQGVITTVADGGPVYGDRTPALQSTLEVPDAVALDAHRSLFISSSLQFRVLKLDAQGILSAVYGVQGDINHDGVIDITDAELALKYILGLITLPFDEIGALDYNLDGKYDLSDVVLILRNAVGL